MQRLEEQLPRVNEPFRGFCEKAFAEGALDARTKHLIALIHTKDFPGYK